jgi:hypothetical protein
MSRWGATPSDLSRVMAGDSLLADPTYSGTMAVSVDAPPEDVWPWLVQIGCQRGGLYNCTRNLRFESAWRAPRRKFISMAVTVYTESFVS